MTARVTDGHNAPSVEVVIPVRDAAALIGECIDTVVPQMREGDVLTVVDDASADDTAEIAERHGARVLRLDAARGPYAARQLAGMASDADVLVFLDARCRVRDGWLESHRRAMRCRDVALSCSEVFAVARNSLASRVAARQQPFRLEATVPVGAGLPYYPTCNLGVRASAFRAVGGFAEVRSGGTLTSAGEYNGPASGDWPSTTGDWCIGSRETAFPPWPSNGVDMGSRGPGWMLRPTLRRRRDSGPRWWRHCVPRGRSCVAS